MWVIDRHFSQGRWIGADLGRGCRSPSILRTNVDNWLKPTEPYRQYPPRFGPLVDCMRPLDVTEVCWRGRILHPSLHCNGACRVISDAVQRYDSWAIRREQDHLVSSQFINNPFLSILLSSFLSKTTSSMLALRALTLLLPALSAAYSLKACTDTGCKEGCVDFSADVWSRSPLPPQHRTLLTFV